MVVLISVLGIVFSEMGLPRVSWGKRAALALTVEEAATKLSAFWADATPESWLQAVQGLTPEAKVEFSLLGHELRLHGQAEIAKAIREHQTLLDGLRIEASNPVVRVASGRLASVLVPAVVRCTRTDIEAPVMLRVALIRVQNRWLIHHVVTEEGYMSLI